jgi:hypothetical protein
MDEKINYFWEIYELNDGFNPNIELDVKYGLT